MALEQLTYRKTGELRAREIRAALTRSCGDVCSHQFHLAADIGYQSVGLRLGVGVGYAVARERGRGVRLA